MNTDNHQSRKVHVASGSRSEHSKHKSNNTDEHVEHSKSKRLKQSTGKTVTMTTRTGDIVHNNKIDTNAEYESQSKKSDKSRRRRCRQRDKRRIINDLEKDNDPENRSVLNTDTSCNGTSATPVDGTKRIRSVVAEVCGSHSRKSSQSRLYTSDKLEVNNSKATKHYHHDRDIRNRNQINQEHSSTSLNENRRLFDQTERKLQKSLKYQQNTSRGLSWSQVVLGQQDVSQVMTVPHVKPFKIKIASKSFDKGTKNHSPKISSKVGAGNNSITCELVVGQDLVKEKVQTVYDWNGNPITKFVATKLSDLEDGEIIDRDGSDISNKNQKTIKKKSLTKVKDVSSTSEEFVEELFSKNKAQHKSKVDSYEPLNDDGWHTVRSRSSSSRTHGQFKDKNSKTRLKVENCEQLHQIKSEQSVTLTRSEVVKDKGEKEAFKIPLHSPLAVLEEGELSSDTDSNTVQQVLSSSGSDMSISSEDSSKEDSHILVEEVRELIPSVGFHQTQSSSVVTHQTSETENVLTSRLNASALSFIPKLHLPTVDMKNYQQVGNTVHHMSDIFVTQTPPSYFGVPANHDDITLKFYQPDHPTNYVLPSLPTSNSQLFKDSYQQSLGSKLLTTSNIPQTFSNIRASTFTNYSDCSSSQTCRKAGTSSTTSNDGSEMYNLSPSGRIPLNMSGQQTCPELTDTPRCWHTVNRQSGTQTGNLQFTVMSYNILSQELLLRHEYLYSKCQYDDLEWTNRRAALLTQIVAHDADIVCLQEMQADHWIEDFQETLAGHGYYGVYKQANEKPDGCAILFKTDKFKQIKYIPVDFQKGGILDRGNIGIIMLLQPRPEVYGGNVQKICVATTHLLFNPRRGDVKLAQLIVFLAEIDKHAYIGDHLDSRKRFPGVNDNSPSNSPLNGNQESTSVNNDSSPESNKPQPPLNIEMSIPGHHYCPIILCGDFNSEPFSDLYKFITTGYLRYEKLISRFLCGQKEGQFGGSNMAVGKSLLPRDLRIGETCQYIHVLKERQNAGHVCCSNQQPIMNSGRLFHTMNFQSVYSHVIQLQGTGHPEISSRHNNCSCTVDYIFYSTSQVKQQQQRHQQQYNSDNSSSKTSHCSNSYLSDSQRHTSANKDVADPNIQTLQLIARYRLMTTKELTKFGFTPNSVLPSDHLCLIAKFLLR